MICAADSPNRRAQFESACAADSYWPVRLRADMQIFGGKPGSGWQFFTAPGMALEIAPGGSAVLVGTALPGELGSFLAFLGVHTLTAPAGAKCPEGFAVGETLTEFAAFAPPLSPPAFGEPLRRDETFSPRLAAALMGMLSPDEQEDFFAQCCARRNHGHGLAWGAWDGQKPVCTVGVCAFAPPPGRTACMFAGETLPEYRGRGIGGRLIASLAEEMLARGCVPRFVCRPERVHFYTRLGFAPTGEHKEYNSKETS